MTDERRNVIVEARPEPLAIYSRRMAVVVVDMQNDFGAEGEMFARAGVPIAAIAAPVDRARPREMRVFRFCTIERRSGASEHEHA